MGGEFNHWLAVGKSKRIATKFLRYAKTGQLKNGKWFCKAGRPITEARVHKYENMCHFMVRKFLPAHALFEASMGYEDLINQCRLEVFLALLDGFDPEKAMSSNLEDLEKRKAAIAKKMADPEGTLDKAEISIVYGRLLNYLRRTTWKFHPNQLGGRSHSLEEIEDGLNQEYKNRCYTPSEEFSDAALKKKEQLLDLIDTFKRGGSGLAKIAFNRLKKEDPEVAEAILDYLRQG